MNQLLTLQDLELKRSVMLSKTNNDPKTELEFRKTCALYENQKSTITIPTYLDYVSAYRRITSLYWINENDSEGFTKYMNIFDTEKESANFFKLRVPILVNSGTRITMLPNFGLYCYWHYLNSGIILSIDSDNKYTFRLLPDRQLGSYFSAIYFDNNLYFFGGVDSISCRYDLDKNLWINLTQMVQKYNKCHSAIFNRNILISGNFSKNLLLYSIDIGSFSTIPYDFAENKRKILINAGRMYLVECSNEKDGFIYESEAENEYNWTKIAKSIIGGDLPAYWSYNKGKIYIIIEDCGLKYYKFDLRKNKFLI